MPDLPLFDQPQPAPPPPPATKTPQVFDTHWGRRAAAWMKRNRKAYNLFVHYALKLGKRDRPFGFRMIAEVVRFHVILHGWQAQEEYKINNCYIPYIARRVVQEYPELADLVEFREAKFEESSSCPPNPSPSEQ